MGHTGSLFFWVLFRLLIASPFIAGQVWLIYKFGHAGVVFGLPLGMVAGLILWPRIAELLAEPFRALLYPIRRYSKPVPMYSIPQSKRARGDYDGALAEYEKLELEYPGDLQVYREMLEVLVIDLKDRDRASVVFQRAVSELKTTAAKEGLASVYHGMLGQASGKPEWLKEQQRRVLKTSRSKDNQSGKDSA